MEYTTLGRTGLRVSIMGLGCGGPSGIGRRTGHNEEESMGCCCDDVLFYISYRL